MVFGAVSAQSFSNNTVMPIPDGVNVTSGCGLGCTAGSITSAIVVSSVAGVIGAPDKVTVSVDLTHTWCGDIVAELVAPSGASCALIKRLGAGADTECGSSANFAAGQLLNFHASDTTHIHVAGLTTSDPLPAGNYAPTSGLGTYPATIPLCNLSTFLTGVTISGNWLLRVYDHGDGDVGQLNAWQIRFDPGAAAFAGINEYSGAPVRVYPNPASDRLYFDAGQFAGGGDLSASLRDVSGKLVWAAAYPSFGGNTVSVDVSGLAPGMYSLCLEAENLKQIKKVLVGR